MLLCYIILACRVCYHSFLCIGLVVPLVLNIVYGSYSLLWPIIIADMNTYIYIYAYIYIYIFGIFIYTSCFPMTPVCFSTTTSLPWKQTAIFTKNNGSAALKKCRRLLPTYDFGSVPWRKKQWDPWASSRYISGLYLGLSPLPVIVEVKVYRDSLLKMEQSWWSHCGHCYWEGGQPKLYL